MKITPPIRNILIGLLTTTTLLVAILLFQNGPAKTLTKEYFPEIQTHAPELIPNIALAFTATTSGLTLILIALSIPTSHILKRKKISKENKKNTLFLTGCGIACTFLGILDTHQPTKIQTAITWLSLGAKRKLTPLNQQNPEESEKTLLEVIPANPSQKPLLILLPTKTAENLATIMPPPLTNPK